MSERFLGDPAVKCWIHYSLMDVFDEAYEKSWEDATEEEHQDFLKYLTAEYDGLANES